MSLKVFLTINVLLATACGSCAATTSKPEGGSQVETTAPQDSSVGNKLEPIREDLQKKFLEIMAASDIREGFGLFSEGGFSGTGNGQYMFLVRQDGTVLRWTTFGADSPAGRDAFLAVKADLIGRLITEADEADALKDFSASAFDAFSYFYMHCKNSGGKVSCSGKVAIRNLVSTGAGTEAYERLLSRFKTAATSK